MSLKSSRHKLKFRNVVKQNLSMVFVFVIYWFELNLFQMQTQKHSCDVIDFDLGKKVFHLK